MDALIQSPKRTTAETVVRFELVLLLPAAIAGAAFAAARGGAWLVLLLPLGGVLVALTRVLPMLPLRAWLDTGTTVVLTGASIVLALIGIVPHLGLYRPVTVLSGSMRPTFAPGDMIIVTPEPLRDVRVGQVITYAIPVDDHHVESHRVIRVLRGGNDPIVITKGDANRSADPWNAELHGRTIWREQLRIPAVGRAILALRSPLFHDLTVFILPALLALYGLMRIWRMPPRPPRLRADAAS